MTDTDDGQPAEQSSLERIPWRRILNLVGLLVVLAIVVPMLVYTAPQVVGADEGYVVLSGSMEPTMSAGDVIIVESVEASEIETGDIITYGQNPPTTHRVIEVTERDGTRAFRTQGDANEDPDRQVVSPDQLNGRVMTVDGHPVVIPYVGYLIQFASTQVGFAVFVALPFVLFVVFEVWNLVSAGSTEAESGDAETAGDSTAEPTTDVDREASGAAVRDESGTSGGEMTVSTAELELGLFAFGGFAAYGLWVAYATRETWAFGVAGSATAAFLLLLGLYVTGIGLDDGETGKAAGEHSMANGGTVAPEDSSPARTTEAELAIPDEFVADPGDTTENGETQD